MPSFLSNNLVKQVTLAGENGFIGDQETAALKSVIDACFSKDQLADVYQAVRGVAGGGALSQKNRSALIAALFAKDKELGGGTMPMMVTMAVGEDQFGMGNIAFPGRDEVIDVAADGTVSAKETKQLVALFDAAKSPFEFEKLFQSVKTLVAKNLIARADRSALATAALAAQSRVGGDGPVAMMTRAVGEDAFGFDPGMIGNKQIESMLETAGKNGALSAAEVKVLTRQIKLLDADGLKAAYAALDKAVGELKLSKASRGALIGALLERQSKLGVFVVPTVVTMAVGEDQFGIARTQSKTDKELLTASTDGVLSKAEAKRLVCVAEKAATLDDLQDAKDAIAAFLAGNVCSPRERRQLADALQARAQALGGGFAVTRALGEDMFGMGA